MQHFHATIVIQHVSLNKIKFHATYIFHTTKPVSCQIFHVCATSFAKYFMQQKLFHETYFVS